MCGHLGLDWTLVRRLGQQARCRARRRKAESATTELLLVLLRPFTKTYNTSILNDNPTQRTVSIVRYVKRSRTLSKPVQVHDDAGLRTVYGLPETVKYVYGFTIL